jgi:glycosyltransferase involved in cell wall biosynthesis
MVSCLLVTLPVAQRFAHLKRSIASYCRQTYRDTELIIVLDPGPADARAAIEGHVAALGRDDIRIVASPQRVSVGALRNLSLGSARGDFVCQWDDDDLHHPERVERQRGALIESNSQGVLLEEVMQFFPGSRKLYCTNWRATESKGHPGTLMCRRSAPIRYANSGPDAQLGEDTAVVRQLQRHGALHILKGAPHLFVYVSHGDNSFPDDHHRMLARELSISQALLRRREAQLRDGLRSFDFGSGDLTVEGYNGVAFTIGTEHNH